MATEKAPIASGADLGEAIRRRHIPGAQPIGAIPKIELDDKKKLAKKVRRLGLAPAYLLQQACAIQNC